MRKCQILNPGGLGPACTPFRRPCSKSDFATRTEAGSNTSWKQTYQVEKLSTRRNPSAVRYKGYPVSDVEACFERPLEKFERPFWSLETP